MTLGIVTSRTVRSYSRRPPWPYVLNPDSPQARGLTHWWPCDPSGGGRVYDLSGRGNHGTLQTTYPSAASPTWSSADSQGRSLSFLRMASEDYVNLGSPATLDDRNGVTASFWFRYDGLGLGGFGNYAWSDFNAGATSCSFSVRLTSALLMNFFLNGPGNLSVSTTTTIVANTTYHLAVSWDGVSVRRIYLNGKQEASNNSAETIPTSPVGNFSFGRAGDLGGAFDWGGLMWDMRWYQNIALPANVIEQMWDGNTRWDLYYQPGLRSWLLPSATVSKPFNAAWSAGNKLIGGGIC